MKEYTTLTNEELVNLAAEGDNAAYEQLFRNLKPIVLKEAKMYLGKMPIYSLEDLQQEADILVWNIISRGNFKGGSFANYYTSAVRFRFCNIFRDYSLKNLVVISEKLDEHGNGYNTAILGEAEYAKKCREKHREQCRRSYAKKKEQEAEERRAAGIPDPEPKKKQTKEERIAKQVAYQKEYYATHPDKLEERRAKARERERLKREAKKAEKAARKAETEN